MRNVGGEKVSDAHVKEPEIRIVNVVATARLEHGLDLQAVAKAFPSTEYRPNVFPGLVFHTKRPRIANLLFNTGKMVCTGAKSVKGARNALKKVVRQLKKSGIIIEGRLQIKIQNIVASVVLGGRVDIEDFYKVGGGANPTGSMMYEPEQFPGLIYRMRDPKAVLLVFSTGKMVCTGAKKEEDVHHAVRNLRQELNESGVIFYHTV